MGFVLMALEKKLIIRYEFLENYKSAIFSKTFDFLLKSWFAFPARKFSSYMFGALVDCSVQLDDAENDEKRLHSDKLLANIKQITAKCTHHFHSKYYLQSSTTQFSFRNSPKATPTHHLLTPQSVLILNQALSYVFRDGLYADKGLDEYVLP